MSDFLDLLALYYLCDATALVRTMSGDEVIACTGIYDAVKAWFAPFDLAPVGSLERHAQMIEGYLGFQDWQAANAELVATMRDDAMAEARGVAGALMR
ncbi:hypothetical protein [Hasllibacter sp. MH4015]|uniref:hypothetical protein n=1 Tax=Hasllibacter sp. MH4015 TaxID=2854029 RepID=UPI001CD3779E|nr:hypothetical protein [Hasllibacter sp. MH4015]